MEQGVAGGGDFSCGLRHQVRLATRQPRTPVARVLQATVFFAINVHAALHRQGWDASFVQRCGGQFAHASVGTAAEGECLVGAGVEYPGYAQALGEGAVVDGVGQPVEARDFGFGGFAGLGEGGDQLPFEAGAVAFGQRHRGSGCAWLRGAGPALSDSALSIRRAINRTRLRRGKAVKHFWGESASRWNMHILPAL